SVFAAVNAGNMEAVREMLDPGVVIGRELEGWPETGPFVGRDAVMRGWERNREPFGDTVRVEPVSIIEGPGGCEADRARSRPRARTPRGVHHPFHTSKRQDHSHRLLLGPCRGPQSRGAGGRMKVKASGRIRPPLRRLCLVRVTTS